MCVYNELYKQAIIHSENYIFDFARRGLVKGSSMQQYLSIREPIINLYYSFPTR